MEKKNSIHSAVKNYRRGLESRMAEHMGMDGNARNTSSISDMCESWEKLHKMEKHLARCKLGPEEIHEWMDDLKNADGTSGAHWNKDQTTAAAKMAGVLMGHITPEDFWAAMNVMYSDYSPVAEKFNVNKPEFFAELAKSFLFDKDGPAPADKLAAYFHGVVEHEE